MSDSYPWIHCCQWFLTKKDHLGFVFDFPGLNRRLNYWRYQIIFPHNLFRFIQEMNAVSKYSNWIKFDCKPNRRKMRCWTFRIRACSNVQTSIIISSNSRRGMVTLAYNSWGKSFNFYYRQNMCVTWNRSDLVAQTNISSDRKNNGNN